MTGFAAATLSYDANENLTVDGIEEYTWDVGNHIVVQRPTVAPAAI
jgi:hypothetical protein